MNSRTHTKSSGNAAVALLLFLLLLASLSLNAFLYMRGEAEPENPVPPPYDATEDLRGLALKLGAAADGATAQELIQAIDTKIYVDTTSKKFPREILSETGMEDACSNASQNDKEILRSYQDFIKSLKGKRFLIIP